MKSLTNRALAESLEPRLLMSGEWIDYTLVVTDLNDHPISAIEIGHDFKLKAYAQDVREAPEGVFSGYLDVTFDQAVAQPKPDASFSYGDDFPNGQAGDTLSAGLLDEVGAFSGQTPLGSDPTLLFSRAFTATAAGTVVFAGDAADNSVDHPTLVYGLDLVVSADQVLYGTATLQVVDEINPTADLSHPTDGGSIDQTVINATERYIDVTFTDISGTGLDASTVTDGNAEFTVSGAAAFGVAIDGDATLVSGTTYRYTFTGDFGPGAVTVLFAGNSFADNAGNLAAASSESFTVTVGTPEIAISGNAQGIADGDTTPDTADGTLFGALDVNALLAHTFTIHNTGTGAMSLTGTPRVQISGVDQADFIVTQQPAASVATGGSTTFVLQFSPHSIGTRTATVSVVSDDADDGTYTFDVEGAGGRVLAFGGKVAAKYTDANGDAVSVSLKDAGNGQVWLPTVNPTTHADASQIVLTGTGVKSILTVTAKGGDKRTSVGDITVQGPLKQLSAACLDVSDGEIIVDGTLGGLTLGDITASNMLVCNDQDAARDPKAQLALKALQVEDFSIDTNGQGISSISVLAWTDGGGQADTITSSWLGTLTVKGATGISGDFEAELSLDASRDVLSAKLPALALGSITVSGTLTPGQWDIVGAIGVMKAGAVGDGLIGADTIKSITTSGNKALLLAGDFAADIELAGPLVAGKTATLGTTKIAGNLTSDSWQIAGDLAGLTVTGRVQAATVATTGNMGALSLGASAGADFLAGVTPAAGGVQGVTRHADDAADFTALRSIKSIAIKGIKGAAASTSFFDDSNFSAASIGVATLINVKYDTGQAGANAADAFGFWAQSVKSVSQKTLLSKVGSWAWPKQPLTNAQVDLTIDLLV